MPTLKPSKPTKAISDSVIRTPRSYYCWFSYDATKIQSTKLTIAPVLLRGGGAKFVPVIATLPILGNLNFKEFNSIQFQNSVPILPKLCFLAT